jgi:radical SAM superfamily enzyme YgiQ (UPF0313 family)
VVVLKILLVYPRYPDTFWSFRHALKFISKKASFPPLGLLTIAAMMPAGWSQKLVDMNVADLTDEDIKWADYVYLSAMAVQEDSAREIIARSQGLGTAVVAGGPLFSTEPEEFSGVDHLVLDEAEVTLPLFLADLERGKPQRIYTSTERPDIEKTPIPLWSLVDMKKYSSMNIQYSRGCPYDCEFCDIIVLNGRRPRTKSKDQVLNELAALYRHGWRGSVFFVDDNFIGNKKKLKTEILPAIIEWRRRKRYPFVLSTEASINLADDDELMRLMATAGFDTVFVGVETPNEESLAECNKQQNQQVDMVAAVKRMQHHGLQVQGGFIVGFDSDPLSIFKSQISFIQKSGIVTAMVGLLNAPRGTRLYQRLEKENRLLGRSTGDNSDCAMNFIPRMNYQTLIDGYKQILEGIYSPKQYYERVKTFLREYRPQVKARPKLEFYHIKAFVRSLWLLGVKDRGRWYYWKLLISTLFRRPRSLPLSLTLSVYGYHFRRIVARYVSTPAPQMAQAPPNGKPGG